MLNEFCKQELHHIWWPTIDNTLNAFVACKKFTKIIFWEWEDLLFNWKPSFLFREQSDWSWNVTSREVNEQDRWFDMMRTRSTTKNEFPLDIGGSDVKRDSFTAHSINILQTVTVSWIWLNHKKQLHTPFYYPRSRMSIEGYLYMCVYVNECEFTSCTAPPQHLRRFLQTYPTVYSLYLH